MRQYYPHLLVVLQYGLMALMFLFSKSVPEGWVWGLFVLGFLLGLWAMAHNRIGNFHIRPELKTDAVLVTTGIYRFVRHPMYLSVALMMLALLINTPSLLEYGFFSALLLVLYLKASREERLWLLHHQGYHAYRKKTRLFLPFLL